MEATPFLAGLVMAAAGGLIVSFDYPQLLLLEGAGVHAAGYGPIYQRLLAEAAVGAAVLAAGAALAAVSAIGGSVRKPR